VYKPTTAREKDAENRAAYHFSFTYLAKINYAAVQLLHKP